MILADVLTENTNKEENLPLCPWSVAVLHEWYNT